ncbi:helix-turn-helix domain-containing protein [Actinacidiphila acididurans]|uniref:Helix-turn-helix domain-containing protein n=1 Tax=Actinacidiphila acididurans TaxID=2784346 RepID=A0ABS2TWL9_9ACTN|nr:helix-turn-helix transcriptional regulator [Actinacidiphila acididurans]MBM9506876.1 helix-turn-helix domain-containing protein [Actinacidiphila acididurans]
MDRQREIRDFLVSRRGRVSPRQAGLPALGAHRRVPGLRREEVALLAGVSVDYYVRLERGHLGGASDSVLNAVADALQLDTAERSHLFDLARSASGRGWEASGDPVPEGVQRVLDVMGVVPAFVWNRRLDLVAANYLGYALYAPMFAERSAGPVNIARFKFLDPEARSFFYDWEHSIRNTVALLRTGAGMMPEDPGMKDLIAELSAASEPFRRCWRDHEVRLHWDGVKEYEHPVVGRLSLPFQTLTVPGRPDLMMSVLTPEPGSESAQRVRLLSDWADSRPALEVAAGRL